MIDHVYVTELAWEGSTRAGRAAYGRAHSVVAPPATAVLDLSADPAFGGDADRLNPEHLLLAAASSCQLLSFLAVAARAGVDVVSYRDDAEAEMPDPAPGGGPVRITTVRLRPRVEVRAPATPEQVERLLEQAHTGCYVARSLTAEVELAPHVSVVP